MQTESCREPCSGAGISFQARTLPTALPLSSSNVLTEEPLSVGRRSHGDPQAVSVSSSLALGLDFANSQPLLVKGLGSLLFPALGAGRQ